MNRAEAKGLGLIKYSTGKPCINGHLSERYTATWHCVACKLLRHAAESATAERKEWLASYRKTANAKVLAAVRNARYLAKPEKRAARLRQKKAYWARNQFRWRMYRASRLARLKNATPNWVDFSAIEAIYLEADRRTKTTGIPHEVDHHYPIAGRNSCGLHVPWNLKILTSDANKKKSNKPPESAT